MIIRRAIAGVWRVRAWLALRDARRSSLEKLQVCRPRRVLVVCYGNIYRSAFVGGYLKTRVPPGVVIRSTGFHEQKGRPCPGRHVTMSRARGVDLSRHESSVIAVADLEWAEIIVLMDRKNWVRLRRMGADESRLIWLGALAPGPVEVEDPYKMDDASASQLLEKLARCSSALASSLQKPA